MSMCDVCDYDVCDYIAQQGGDPDDPELFEEFQRAWRRDVTESIRRGHWKVVAVDDWPPFAYTVGLWSRGRPELLVIGLPPRPAGRLLNLAGNAVRDGLEIDEETEYDFGGAPVKAFWVPNAGEVVLRENWFYRRKPKDSVPVLQLVYPDAHGTWPWEPDCHLPPGQQPMPGEFAA
jgi:uncharacterized protein DUF4262